MHISVFISYDSRVTGAHDLLLVLSGELVWNDSPLSAISRAFGFNIEPFIAHAVDIVTSLLPVIGPIYDISTGVVGRRLPDGARLTNWERVLRIVLVGVGVLVGLVVKGVRVSVRTLAVIDAGLKVRLLRSSLSEVNLFRALFVSVGKLSPKNAALIQEIIEIIRKGGKLSPYQEHILHSFFHSVNQTATALHWAVLAKDSAHVRETIGSTVVLNFVTHEPGEREAIEVLTKNMPGAEIVALPALTPTDFLAVAAGTTKLNPATRKPILRATQDVKMPDLLIGPALADMLLPKGTNMKNLLNEMAAKSSQGSTVVVSTDLTTLTPQAIIAKLPNLWGNPVGLSVRRVIVLNSKGFFGMVTRPANLRFADIVIPVQSLENLREMWNELEKDDAALAAGK